MSLFAQSAIPLQGFWTVTVAAVCGVSCALLGCFLMLRRMSLLGDGISHGVLPGIALAVMAGALLPGGDVLLGGRATGFAILVGAMVFGLLTAVLAEALAGLGNVTEDASLGVVFSSLFALGVILISVFLRHTDVDIGCVFLGLLEGVPVYTFDLFGLPVPTALPTMLLSLLLSVSFIALFWKELLLVAFDAPLARAMGFRPALVNYLLIALVAGSTVAAFEALGSILVLAMLVVPPATAHLLTDRLPRMLLLSALFAFTACLLGYLIARYGPTPTNTPGAIAVVAGLQLGLAVLAAPRHGLLVTMGRRFELALRIAGEEVLTLLYRAEETGTPAYHLAPKEHSLPPWVVRLAYRRLRRRGLIAVGADGLARLTEAGRIEAGRVVRSHRLWETYAGLVLELPPDHVHAPASRAEHYIGPQLQAELAETLQQPPTDPHGKTIPPPAI